jgi:hypothetical protein
VAGSTRAHRLGIPPTRRTADWSSCAQIVTRGPSGARRRKARRREPEFQQRSKGVASQLRESGCRVENRPQAGLLRRERRDSNPPPGVRGRADGSASSHSKSLDPRWIAASRLSWAVGAAWLREAVSSRLDMNRARGHFPVCHRRGRRHALRLDGGATRGKRAGVRLGAGPALELRIEG